jgi:hypothetical protein
MKIKTAMNTARYVKKIFKLLLVIILLPLFLLAILFGFVMTNWEDEREVENALQAVKNIFW